MDGRKATGGKLEVRVKIREPLSGVDLQPVTEKWLVLDPVSSLSPPERQKERVSRVFVSPDLHVCRLWKETEAEKIAVFVGFHTGGTWKLLTKASAGRVMFTFRTLLCFCVTKMSHPKKWIVMCVRTQMSKGQYALLKISGSQYEVTVWDASSKLICLKHNPACGQDVSCCPLCNMLSSCNPLCKAYTCRSNRS